MSDVTNPSQGLPAGGVPVTFVPGTEEKAAAALAAANAAEAEKAKQPEQEKQPAATELGEPEKQAPAQADPNATTDEPYTYEPTGNASLDYVLGFLGRNGFGDTHPGVVAAQQGNFELLAAELATKGVAGATEVLALAKSAYAEHTKSQAAKASEVGGYAVQAAGGDAQWQTVRAWAAANADPSEKAELNAAMAKGGLAARMAIDYIVKCYSAKHTLAKDPKTAVSDVAAGGGGGSDGPMTARDYARAVNELSRANRGHDVSHLPEYKALQAQRLAAISQGY